MAIRSSNQFIRLYVLNLKKIYSISEKFFVKYEQNNTHIAYMS